MNAVQPGAVLNPAATPTWDPAGYPKLAHLFGRLPEVAVFRKFGPLNMMTLLSLQAKLVMLEADLWKICYEDQRSTHKPDEILWKSLAEIHSEAAPGNIRAQKLRIIQETLKEYRKSLSPPFQNWYLMMLDEQLLVFSNVSKLSSPRRDQVRFLQNWLEGAQEGMNFLRGRERFTWNNKYEFDLVVPVSSRPWVHPTLIELMHWVKKKMWFNLCLMWKGTPRPKKTPPRPDFFDVEEGKLGRAEDFDKKGFPRFMAFVWRLAVLLTSSMIPVLAVLVLYYIPQTINRIGAAIGMTAFAALFLRFFTSASIKEIFGATAA